MVHDISPALLLARNLLAISGKVICSCAKNELLPCNSLFLEHLFPSAIHKPVNTTLMSKHISSNSLNSSKLRVERGVPVSQAAVRTPGTNLQRQIPKDAPPGLAQLGARSKCQKAVESKSATATSLFQRTCYWML